MLDYHTHTYRYSRPFRRFMWRTYGWRWWFWTSRAKRAAAKQWNHAKAHSMSDDKMRMVLRRMRGRVGEP